VVAAAAAAAASVCESAMTTVNMTLAYNKLCVRMNSINNVVSQPTLDANWARDSMGPLDANQ